MIQDSFRRYIWLVETISKGRYTLEELQKAWRDRDDNYEKEELSRRTFQQSVITIGEIFGIDIECDRKNGYTYYIDAHTDKPFNLQKDFLASSKIMSKVSCDKEVMSRIIPDDELWSDPNLETVAVAMKKKVKIKFDTPAFAYHGKPINQRYFKPAMSPYFVKRVAGHWFLFGESMFGSHKEVWAQDMESIPHAITLTEEPFELPENFNPEDYYNRLYAPVKRFIPIRILVVGGIAVRALKKRPLFDNQKLEKECITSNKTQDAKSYAVFSYVIPDDELAKRIFYINILPHYGSIWFMGNDGIEENLQQSFKLTRNKNPEIEALIIANSTNHNNL